MFLVTIGYLTPVLLRLTRPSCPLSNLRNFSFCDAPRACYGKLSILVIPHLSPSIHCFNLTEAKPRSWGLAALALLSFLPSKSPFIKQLRIGSFSDSATIPIVSTRNTSWTYVPCMKSLDVGRSILEPGTVVSMSRIYRR
jgi:hypothetical protein